jgi:hypothetical protein
MPRAIARFVISPVSVLTRSALKACLQHACAERVLFLEEDGLDRAARAPAHTSFVPECPLYKSPERSPDPFP